jgi:NitT/TauT family transport system substrate-binding protein
VRLAHCPVPLVATTLAILAACGGRSGGQTPARLRLGHFPNVTHAQALYGRVTGSFEKALGQPVAWTQFNAGPSAVEALFAGAVDASYLGPNPAINGWVKSQGRSFVIVAGAASGGAALVVRADAGIVGEGDFHGRTVATPQLGNTQDVAARQWFAAHGYVTRERGGDLTILPLANPDQLLMFQKKQLAAAWTVEPWVSRLEQEGGGRVFLDEKTLWPEGRYATAVLVVRREFLARHADLVVRLLAAHVEATQALAADRDAAAALLAAEIKRETSATLPVAVVRSALDRIELTWDPSAATLAKSAADAHRIGFLHQEPHLAGIVDVGPLNQVLAAKHLPPISAETAR